MDHGDATFSGAADGGAQGVRLYLFRAPKVRVASRAR
jgi:hypothetical protein